jgi:hypothetical protein
VTEIFAFARRAGAHDRGNLAQMRAPDLRRCSLSERRIITTDGSERSVKGAVIDKPASDLRGELLCCDDPGYDAARKVRNGMVDKRPALIARCAGTADIISCARLVREYNLFVSVCGIGHHYAGKSVCTAGFMIDLSPMKGVRVDPAARTARAQPGPRLGEFRP